jgi:hypothetical protein
MKKLYLWVAILVVPLFLATGAWALVVDDEQGVPGAYYGGVWTTVGPPVTQNPAYAFDTAPAGGQPGSTDFSVTILTATSIASGYIQVVLTGNYFTTQYANPSDTTVNAKPGDLYISSKGWVVSTPSPDGHADADTFNPSTEGWDYVIAYSSAAPAPFNTAMYQLNGSYTATSGQGEFTDYRTDQAWRGGYGTLVSANALSILDMNAGTLTFKFPGQGLDPDKIGYHWTMGCGNDVVEGGGTPVPEPSIMFLLGLGLVGLLRFRRKFRQ